MLLGILLVIIIISYLRCFLDNNNLFIKNICYHMRSLFLYDVSDKNINTNIIIIIYSQIICSILLNPRDNIVEFCFRYSVTELIREIMFQ